MKIVVLLGGISTERAVSINSGSNVAKALKERGHQVIPVDVYFGSPRPYDFGKDYDIDAEIEEIKTFDDCLEETVRTRRSFFGANVMQICKEADFVFLALHGENGENGKVQACLDLEGIKYTGTGYYGSAIAMDKWFSKLLFVSNEVLNPNGAVLYKDGRKEILSKNKTVSSNCDASVKSASALRLSYPVVVKPCCGGSSVGVSIANNDSEFEAALEEAFAFENKLVIEEFIEGQEFTCGVFDGKALPVVLVVPKNGWYDYKNKYGAGLTDHICPAPVSKELTDKIQRAAEKVGVALGLDTYYRADFRVDKDENVYCLEANTLPGMTSTSLIPDEAAAIGISYPELCEKLIEISNKKYE